MLSNDDIRTVLAKAEDEMPGDPQLYLVAWLVCLLDPPANAR